MEACILSTYAGGHAQRRFDPSSGSDGCEGDEEQAEVWLMRCGWQEREQELREWSRELVDEHWVAIERVTLALMRLKALHWDEVALIADGEDVDHRRFDEWRRRWIAAKSTPK